MEIEIYRLNKSGLGQDNDVVRGPDFHTYPHEAPFPPRAIFFGVQWCSLFTLSLRTPPRVVDLRSEKCASSRQGPPGKGNLMVPIA